MSIVANTNTNILEIADRLYKIRSTFDVCFPIDHYDFQYINLTNGIEILTDHLRFVIHTDDRLCFARMQSTLCEQKKFDLFIQEIDNNLLFRLASGRKCLFFDYTSRLSNGLESRAIWQGLEFIKFCCNKIWFGKEEKCYNGNAHVMNNEFRHFYNVLNRSTINKLKYFTKFLSTDKLYISSICSYTDLDSKTDEYINILKNWNKQMRDDPY